jgi:hypothetical protein
MPLGLVYFAYGSKAIYSDWLIARRLLCCSQELLFYCRHSLGHLLKACQASSVQKEGQVGRVGTNWKHSANCSALRAAVCQQEHAILYNDAAVLWMLLCYPYSFTIRIVLSLHTFTGACSSQPSSLADPS